MKKVRSIIPKTINQHNDPAIAYHGIIMSMTQIQKWQKQVESIDPQKGGYSDMRLWPAYMISSILILTLSPLIGSFMAFALVLTPALFIAIRAAKIENSNPEANASYQARMDAIYNIPEINKVVKVKSAVQQTVAQDTKVTAPKASTALTPSFSS